MCPRCGFPPQRMGTLSWSDCRRKPWSHPARPDIRPSPPSSILRTQADTLTRLSSHPCCPVSQRSAVAAGLRRAGRSRTTRVGRPPSPIGGCTGRPRPPCRWRVRNARSRGLDSRDPTARRVPSRRSRHRWTSGVLGRPYAGLRSNPAFHGLCISSPGKRPEPSSGSASPPSSRIRSMLGCHRSCTQQAPHSIPPGIPHMRSRYRRCPHRGRMTRRLRCA